MTSVRAIRIAASSWTPRGSGNEPPAAALPIEVEVVGSTVRLVPDLACEIAERTTWGVLNENVIPADTLPVGAVAGMPAGSLVIRTQQSQPAPDYSDQSAAPEVSRIRLDLIQTITQNRSDLGLLHDRREDVLRIVSGMNADIGKVDPHEQADWHAADWAHGDWG